MKFIAIFTVLTFSLSFQILEAQRLEKQEVTLDHDQRWVGKNGKSIHGVFIKREGDIITVLKKNSEKTYQIDINNLNKKTQQWFLAEWTKREAEKEANQKEGNLPQQGNISVDNRKKVKLKPGSVLDLYRLPLLDTTGYKAVDKDKANRANIPNYAQNKYGKKASDCVPNSYAMFLSWWHLSGWVKLPGKERNYDDKVDWLHKRLARVLKTRNNSGTSTSKSIEGLNKFFLKEAKSKHAFTFQRIEDYRPENLPKFTKGSNATILMLSVYHGKKYNGGHAVALKFAHEDGTLEFNTWGLSLKGRLKKIPNSEVKKRIRIAKEDGNIEVKTISLPSYEIELMNKIDLPEWFTDDETRFVLEAKRYDELIVITPYLAPDKKK